MFIQTEDTPNPATMKFLPNRLVTGERAGREFETPESATVSPLAMALFGIQGVQRIFLGRDFISVTRDEKTGWQTLRPLVLHAIMQHFLEERPVYLDETENSANGSSTNESSSCCSPCFSSHACAGTSPQDMETAQKICKVLDERIRPAVAQDGGDITFERYEDGIAYLRLRGACAGCPSATATLKMGVERLLNTLVPEVREVRQVR